MVNKKSKKQARITERKKLDTTERSKIMRIESEKAKIQAKIKQELDAQEKEQTKTAETSPNTKKTLNMLYAIVALLAVFGVLFVLLSINFGKGDVKTPLKNLTGANYTDTNLGTLNITVGSLPVLGSANAVITIVQFGDYQCPACGSFYTNVEVKIKNDYVNTGKAKMYFRDLPLKSLHDKAEMAALAARCANEQEKFWEMHDKLFNTRNEWSFLTVSSAASKTADYATELGLNRDQFATCLDSEKYKSDVDADFNYFVAKLGSPSTPTTFILLPKNKTEFNALKNLSNNYPDNVVLVQSGDNYVVGVIGVIPYDLFKVILDSVKP